MCNIIKDIGTIWTRLFDHKAFLNGEIQFTIREFEQKRGDKEVDQLFSILETITDIRDTKINTLITAAQDNLQDTRLKLNEAIDICDKIKDTEDKYKQNDLLEIKKQLRKAEWETLMNNLTVSCSNIDSAFEVKEKQLEEFYSDLENKLVA